MKERANLELEGRPPVSVRDPKDLERELRKLRSSGPSSFAILTAENGDYLQTAGGPGGLLVEKRIKASGRHFRAFQPAPVVPFEDGTELVFSAGRVKLNANEWFALKQVIEVFSTFLRGTAEPSYLSWRDITGVLNQN